MQNFLIEKKRIYSSEKQIIDADFKNNELLILLNDRIENSVELNGIPLLKVSKDSYLIRYTKNNFCIVIGDDLTFYTLAGEFISSVHVGKHIHQLFPFKNGVICIYGDQGVFGSDVGQHILNFAEPNKPLQSLEHFALQYNFSFDALLARAKPLAAIDVEDNALRFFNEQLQQQQMFPAPFPLGNSQSFAVTFDSAIFVEDERFIIWPYLQGEDFSQIPLQTTAAIRALNFRDSGYFIAINSYEITHFSKRGSHD